MSTTPRLCRFGGCRSYGKMDGYCLIHIKEAVTPASVAPTPLLTPSLAPLRIASPPPLASPKPSTPQGSMPITHLPAVCNGRWQCFVPGCAITAAPGLPFCTEHEHATLTVDVGKPTTGRRKRKSPTPTPRTTARPRTTHDAPSCDEVYRQQLDVSEHAQILATLART
ncbi:hypothetical protein SDRG_03236 [Saprolegnia diclina VS20]|uniref:Uncharacterized protein n=1 Tax=Saprolegnia diclina (strain VS20) TaxID=1156394 RepID=T0QNX2_SAPDV|nr:hypothetical protein SDRG_03236 [Saprolegnia diclina VS20]EQC39814.1 hypothetical protein SDRG_03236 [Saprolegnia diclina VS20]|eukprot:XP_008607086.1 hypothetical protein SDRG_03236 [Saprolegnia diclina VS20]